MIKSKNIIAGLMLLLVAAPILVFTTLFISQKIAQHTMEEKLEKASLQTITLSTSDFIWLEKGKEIKIGNEMFDVKSFYKKADKFVFTGLYDKKEKEINNQMNILVNNKNTDQHSSGLLVLKLSQTVCVISNSIDLPAPFFSIHKKMYKFFNEKELAFSTSINTPPPSL
jgi:hypothetical protein